MRDESGTLIFCDGACSGNPGPGGWAAIVVSPQGEVIELGGREEKTTNNRMELRAAIEALRKAETFAGPVAIYTDSVYVIRGITQWIFAWRKRNWKSTTGEPVANQELWEALSAYTSRRKGADKVSWNFVKGHSGHAANDRVDELAVAFSRGEKPTLFAGNIATYPVSLALPATYDAKAASFKSTKSAKGKMIYLSLVDGIISRHVTWSDCEKHVKGKAGAKYKKVSSETEAETVLRSWGVKG